MNKDVLSTLLTNLILSFIICLSFLINDKTIPLTQQKEDIMTGKQRYVKQVPAQRSAPAVKDISQIVRYLTSTFNSALSELSLDRAARTKKGANKAYELQTEFAYLLNEVMQGPRSLLQKHITDCNEFIDTVLQMKVDTSSE